MMKFLQIFRSLHVSLIFLDALLYMPKFASTFKNLLSNKEKLFEVANTLVNENCSAVILKKLPKKLGDPGKFLIPCNFSEIVECLALADLGASINLMPLSIWRKLSLPELTRTQMIIELADRSTTRPTGIAEDVFMRVGKFHFPADFVVVDYVVDPRVPLILGRPLRTTRALIDVYGEELTLRVCDEAITFKVGNTLKFSYDDAESINQIDVIDVAYEEYSQEVLGFSGNSENCNPTLVVEPIITRSSLSLTLFEGGDFILEEIKNHDSVSRDIHSEDISEFFSAFPVPLENYDFFFEKTERFTSVLEFETFSFDPRENNADVSLPEYECFYPDGDISLLEKFLNKDPSSPLPPKEIKTKELKSIKSSVDEPPELELKDLPSHLEYASLEGTDKLSVIIAKDLKDDEKERLIKVLKSHKQAIAWKLFDIKVIGHKISKSGIEVDRAKVDVIAKLPPPTTIKGVRSFLGHAGEAFETLKKKLTEAPILVAPNWDLPFEIMCVASDFAVGAVLGKRKTKHFQPIPYASKTMTNAQAHYTTTEKELLAVVYAFEKFRPYLVLSKTIVYTDHSALKIEVDRAKVDVIAKLPPPTTVKGVRSFLGHAGFYQFDVEIRDKKGAKNLAADHLSRLENPHQSDLEKKEITKTFPLETLRMVTFRGDSNTPWFADIANYHADGVYTAKKPSISSRLATMDPPGDIMVPTTSLKKYLIQVSIGIRFIEMPMTWSHGVMLVNVKARSCNVMRCLKVQYKFARFLTYGASTLWARSHLLEGTKRTVGENRASWSDKLDDALWVFRTAFKTPIRCTPYKLVYGKACHPPIELEHKAYWALKHCNFDLKSTGDHQKVQMNELNELRNQAYENSLIYKEKTKKIHDSKIKNRVYNVGDRVLLFNSRLKIFSSKLKTRWTGPFTVTQVFLYGIVELASTNGPNFKVNGHRLKHYFRGDIPPMVVPDL
nr:reverse transcriptase domain-containing protein [Tanacetum cinerariifolium]